MAIVLLIKTEDGEVTELAILQKVTMGRSGNTDYKIADIKMSGSHCSFEVNNAGKLIFCDLGSTNGSFLNNSQIMQTMVKVNDVIQVGNTLIKIDEKKLSSSERLSIGVSLISNKNEKTLPDMSKINPNGEGGENGKPKKKTVILNKDIKDKKKMSANWVGSDKVIEQEASSGQTKFLKLEKKKK